MHTALVADVALRDSMTNAIVHTGAAPPAKTNVFDTVFHAPASIAI